MNFKLNLVDSYIPCLPTCNIDADAQAMLRQQIGYFFGPFDKTIFARIKIFLKADIQRLVLVLQPVKIEVKDVAFGRSVFVYNSKRRARGIFGNTQFTAQRVDQRGFACAHLAVKKEGFFGGGETDNFLSGILQIVNTIEMELHAAK